MALHRLFQLSSLLGSAVRVTLRRNIGLSAVLFNKAKDLDPVQKLFLDKIREYNSKSKCVDDAALQWCVCVSQRFSRLSLSLRAVAGGVVDAGPAYQKNLSEEMTKLQRLYGGGDLTKFPQFNFPGEADEDLLLEALV